MQHHPKKDVSTTQEVRGENTPPKGGGGGGQHHPKGRETTKCQLTKVGFADFLNHATNRRQKNAASSTGGRGTQRGRERTTAQSSPPFWWCCLLLSYFWVEVLSSLTLRVAVVLPSFLWVFVFFLLTLIVWGCFPLHYSWVVVLPHLASLWVVLLFASLLLDGAAFLLPLGGAAFPPLSLLGWCCSPLHPRRRRDHHI